MLPKGVLRTQVRGRRESATNSAVETKALCRRWLDGQRTSLWCQGREPTQGRKAKRDKDANVELLQSRVAELVANNSSRKLVQPLLRGSQPQPPSRCSGRCARSTRTLARRRIGIHSSAAPAINTELVAKKLRSFPKGSARGPTGLKPQHVNDAATPTFSDELFRLLAELTTLLAGGRVPEEVQEHICGASLVAIPKSSGGLRPIAVGECLRRLVGKCLASSVMEDAQRRLEPVQVGVGTPGGAEAVAHVTRQWFERHAQDADHVLVKDDMENAFNVDDRQSILEAVREFFPSLAPWADFTYDGASALHLGQHRIPSRRGVQQGDPLGPLSLQRAIEKVRLRALTEAPARIDFVVFYLDDGTIAGKEQSSRMVLQDFAGGALSDRPLGELGNERH